MDAQDSPTNELAAIVEETRRHLEWLRDAGISALPRGDVASPQRGVFAPPGSVASGPGAFARPSAPPAPVQGNRPGVLERPAQPPPALPRPVPTPSTPAAPVAAAPENRVTLLKAIRDDLGDCTRCRLCSSRTHIVFGQGNVNAEVLFVGEGPEAPEDESGQAFVGRGGELLTKMIGAMGYTREQVYLCNIVKCRLPADRPGPKPTMPPRPAPDEIEACRPFVERQIRVVNPKVIVTLGATATHTLLRTSARITDLRNNWQQWEGIPVMPTFHPNYLLQAPDEKRKSWDDLKLVMARLGKQAPQRG